MGIAFSSKAATFKWVVPISIPRRTDTFQTPEKIRLDAEIFNLAHFKLCFGED
jgi:hypothetical protein